MKTKRNEDVLNFLLYLNESFIHLHEKVLDALLIFDIMEHNKPHTACCDKCRYKPFIEFVNYFEVHRICSPRVFIN